MAITFRSDDAWSCLGTMRRVYESLSQAHNRRGHKARSGRAAESRTITCADKVEGCIGIGVGLRCSRCESVSLGAFGRWRYRRTK